MRWLAADIEAEIRWGQPYRGGIEARYIIGADGARSQVARRFELGLNTSFLTGVEVELEGVRGIEEDRLHCFLDARIAPGYFSWVVPGPGIAQVGLASRGRPSLDAFLRKIAGVFDFSRGRIVGRRAGLIPVGGLVRPFARGNVLLVGDAAGLASPLTAGGIQKALHFGRRAAQAVANRLLDGGPAPSGALAALYPRYFWKRLARSVFERLGRNVILERVLGTRFGASLAGSVFFHTRGIEALARTQSHTVSSDRAAQERSWSAPAASG